MRPNATTVPKQTDIKLDEIPISEWSEAEENNEKPLAVEEPSPTQIF